MYRPRAPTNVGLSETLRHQLIDLPEIGCDVIFGLKGKCVQFYFVANFHQVRRFNTKVLNIIPVQTVSSLGAFSIAELFQNSVHHVSEYNLDKTFGFEGCVGRKSTNDFSVQRLVLSAAVWFEL